MIYAYKIKKTEEGYKGHVFDLDFDTKPQPSSEKVQEVISEGLSGVGKFIILDNVWPGLLF